MRNEEHRGRVFWIFCTLLRHVHVWYSFRSIQSAQEREAIPLMDYVMNVVSYLF